ncbi:MAG: hypothetical protein DHS20C06_12810 [Hyphobacterium sp.]|nr:MAG: hypothetical protein DHS20C06_12810 [Hyphobacterium sp.]
MQSIKSEATRLSRSLLRLIERRQSAMRATTRVFPSPQALLGPMRQRLDLAATGIRPESLKRDIRAKLEKLSGAQARLTSSLSRLSRSGRERLASMTLRLGRASPRRVTALSQLQLNKLTPRLTIAGERALQRKTRDLAAIVGRHALLGHHSVLKRGFALIRTANGELVRAAGDLKSGQQISIEMSDTQKTAIIDGKPGPVRPKSRKAQDSYSETQGKLF